MKKIKILILILFLTVQIVIARELTQAERIQKQTILYQTGSNYLNKAYAGSKVLRWNKAYFPIKVYVENDPDMPSYYPSNFIKAAKIWEDETNGIIKLYFTSDPNSANILFKTIKRQAPTRDVSKNETVTLAYTETKFSGDKLLRQTIYFYERNANGKLSPPYEVLNIAVHEFGHALGIHGHSDDPNSIMYAFYDTKKEKHAAFLNRQDKNTLKLLYMITPDITNGDKTKEKGTIDAEVLAGSFEERNDTSIQNAKKEASMKMGDANSRLRLAALYEEKGEYETMLKYLKEAQTYAKTKSELYGVHIGYAYYYYHKKDKQNAKAHILKALEYNNNEDAKKFMYYIDKLH